MGVHKSVYNSTFLKNNQVTHIVNLSGDSIHNIYDPMLSQTKQVRQIVSEVGPEALELQGKVKFFTVKRWKDEYKVPLLDEMATVVDIIQFIEEACDNFKSCLIVSMDNKCKTVVIATVYLMYKYKWSLKTTF